MYKLVKPLFENQPSSFIQRTENGAFIPVNADNTDYQAYLAWVAQGNTPLPADEVTTPSA